jgi:hypothetical protein
MYNSTSSNLRKVRALSAHKPPVRVDGLPVSMRSHIGKYLFKSYIPFNTYVLTIHQLCPRT